MFDPYQTYISQAPLPSPEDFARGRRLVRRTSSEYHQEPWFYSIYIF